MKSKPTIDVGVVIAHGEIYLHAEDLATYFDEHAANEHAYLNYDVSDAMEKAAEMVRNIASGQVTDEY